MEYVVTFFLGMMTSFFSNRGWSIQYVLRNKDTGDVYNISFLMRVVVKRVMKKRGYSENDYIETLPHTYVFTLPQEETFLCMWIFSRYEANGFDWSFNYMDKYLKQDDRNAYFEEFYQPIDNLVFFADKFGVDWFLSMLVCGEPFPMSMPDSGTGGAVPQVIDGGKGRFTGYAPVCKENPDGTNSALPIENPILPMAKIGTLFKKPFVWLAIVAGYLLIKK